MPPSIFSPIPTLSTRPKVTELWTGFCLPFRAVGLIGRSRRLQWLSALSAVITVGALISLAVLLWRWSPALLGTVLPAPSSAWAQAVWEALRFVVFAVLLAIGANAVPTLLLAPLQDPICDAAEALCGDFQPAPFSVARTLRQTASSLGHTAVRLAWLLGGHAALFALNLVPGFGSAAWSVASTVWTMRWASVEYLDAAMGRHLYPLAEVQAGLRRRRALGFGFGAGVWLVLWVPVLNALFVPLALIGGTLLYRGLKLSGDVAGGPPERVPEGVPLTAGKNPHGPGFPVPAGNRLEGPQRHD